MRLLSWFVLLASAFLILSCGDSGPSQPDPQPDPTPGWLKISYSSPNADDGGLLLSVAGGQIDSIRSSFPDFFVASGSTLPIRMIVAGNLTSGTVVAEIKVPDVQAVGDYTATLEQVAARETFQQRAVSGYSLVVQR